jgi:ABC-type Fe3+-hydroxamate transport system substrate-binding protein
MIVQSSSKPSVIPKRIISLVPSQTELLHYLGLEQETVGITKFCIRPKEWYRTKTKIGGTKTLNIAAIKKLGPDLIIANKEENVKEQVEELAAEFNVLVTDVNNIADALQMITNIGRLTHKEAQAEDLISMIRLAFLKMHKAVPAINTAYLIWNKPYMTVGGDTFINDILKSAGFKNIFAHKSRYPVITVDELQQNDCRLLLLSSEPYPFKQKHIDELQRQLPQTKILLADGEMFSWYGSRMLLAVDYLNRMLREL